MQHVIIAIHLMVVIALVALVLYQKSEGSALGMSQSGLFSGRGQANALTRATAILGTIFFLTSIALTVLPAWERRAAGGEDWTSAVDQGKLEVKEIKPTPGGAAPEAGKEKAGEEDKGSIFEQLKRAQQKRQAAPQAPAAPAAEAPAAPPAAVPAQPETPANDKPALRPTTTEEPSTAPKSEAAPQAPAAAAPEVKPADQQSSSPAADAAKPAAQASDSDKQKPAPVAPPLTWAAPTK
jgi:protein translocase SecG subunit